MVYTAMVSYQPMIDERRGVGVFVCMRFMHNSKNCVEHYSVVAKVRKNRYMYVYRILDNYSMSQKNVSKNVQFGFQKRKLSFNAFAVFSSRSVSFPSINCRFVPFYPVH